MLHKLQTLTLAGLMSATGLLADFSYVQTTTVTGGQMAAMARLVGKGNQPTTTTQYVKGDKMATVTPTHTSIIDLSAETITEVDLQKKTYSVMTFAEMKQMLERMTGKGGEDVNFKVSANPTGATKKVSGLDAKEIVITMEAEMKDPKKGRSGTMKITTDTWVASDISGYEEVRAFYKKMATKVNWMPGEAAAMSARPEMSKGMEQVAKEMAKLDGVPVLQVMKMGGGEDMPQMTPEQQAQMESAGRQADSARAQAPQQQAPPSASAALAGALGIPKFGGFGKKKPAAEPAPAPAAPAQPAATTSAGSGGDPSVLMETTIESSAFSTSAIDASKLEVPAGFKKVDSPRAQ